jgi:hypothetical protein
VLDSNNGSAPQNHDGSIDIGIRWNDSHNLIVEYPDSARTITKFEHVSAVTILYRQQRPVMTSVPRVPLVLASLDPQCLDMEDCVPTAVKSRLLATRALRTIETATARSCGRGVWPR